MRRLHHRLDILLADRGLTQAALAKQMGVHSPMISQMKRGDMPAPERWAEIASILGVPVEAVMGVADSPAPGLDAAPPAEAAAPAPNHEARIETLERDMLAVRQILEDLYEKTRALAVKKPIRNPVPTPRRARPIYP